MVGVGDFASVHSGLAETIEALRAIEVPAVLVPGNNETEDALREACAGWERAVVLHGEATEIDGVAFFGLGAGVPVTPWDWSFDLTEEAAAELLEACPEGCVLAVHSPPRGHVDVSGTGRHLGSEAVLRSDREQAAPPGPLRPHPRELGPRIQDRADPGDQPGAGGDAARGLACHYEAPAARADPLNLRQRPRSRPSRRCGH